MGWFDDNSDAHDQVYNQDPHNQASFGHEMLGGAAAFGAMKMFEDHQRREGKPVSHAGAKEFIAGIAGFEADRLAETYGKDEVQKFEARRHAQQQATNMYDEHYGSRDGGYDPNDPNYGPHPTIENVQETNYYYNQQNQRY